MKKLTGIILTAGLLFTGLTHAHAEGNAYGHNKNKAQGKAVGHHKVVNTSVTREEGIKEGDVIYFKETKQPYYPETDWTYTFIGDGGSSDRIELHTGKSYVVGKDISVTEAERMLMNPTYDGGVLEKVTN